MNNIKCGVPLYDFPVPNWNKWKKQTYNMKPLKIVIHNTYNSAKAKAEASYMCGNSNWTSFHTVIDESAIYECIPFNKNAWHCGNQYGNRNYIGIEIAKSTGNINDFKRAERNCAKYVAGILKKFGWNIDRVVTHQYCSGKYCPHKTLDLGWNRFLNMVKEELKDNNYEKIIETQKAGYSLKVVTSDNLTVRKGAGTSYPAVSSYRPTSIIWAESVVTNNKGQKWYKIPNMGYVYAPCCQIISNTPAKPKTPIVLYLNEGDKDVAELLGSLLELPVYRDDGTRTKDNFDIKYVGGQGKNRRETAKFVFNKYL